MQVTKIDTERAEALMKSYNDEITAGLPTDTNLRGKKIDDLFTWGEGGNKNLLSFCAPLSEFGVFDTFVGLSKFSFSFGLLPETDDDIIEGRLPRFTILIKVQNDDGSIQSDYYQLKGVVSTDEVNFIYPAENSSSPLSFSVPATLYEAWTAGWMFPDKRAEFCSIELTMDTNKVTLPIRKYIFNVWDAINVLYQNPTSSLGGLPPDETPTVFIQMVNHCNVEDNMLPSANTAARGKIGFVIGIASPVGAATPKDYMYASSLFDLSKPCPPTC